MEPLLEHLQQRFDCSMGHLIFMMDTYDKRLCSYLRELPMYYNGNAIRFDGFSNRCAGNEKYSKKNPITVQQVYEGRTGKPMDRPAYPCIVEMIDTQTLEKYPPEYLFTCQ